MVKAELLHNPYLLITRAKFNGQEPRINSQIEKYISCPLKDWVRMVPGIFYDEMNGYDFDFDFTGTKTDFDEVRTAFEKAGIDDEKVRLFHKNEIEDATRKSDEIDQLIGWLKANPNQKFDFDAFWKNNSELFEGTYPFVIINGEWGISLGSSVSIENVKNASELQNTDLSSTPILFVVEESNIDQFRKDLVILLAREDIRQKQLFFAIDPCIGEDYVVRIISDLGVKNPQVVRNGDTGIIAKYIREYPVTEYVREAIKIFASLANDIDEILRSENEESEKASAKVGPKLKALDENLLKLQEADEFFVQRDNYDPTHKFDEVRESFEEQLRKWKSRKTKVLGNDEARIYANDFLVYINKLWVNLYNSAVKVFKEEAGSIKRTFSVVYENGTSSHIDTNAIAGEVKIDALPDITTAVLDKKKISYEAAKADFFGMFKKSGEDIEMTKVVASDLNEWRETASELILPLIDKMLEDSCKKLSDYYKSLADEYHSELLKLIAETQKSKEEMASQLSEDEKRLQTDKDWLAELKNQLQIIERG